GAPVIRATRIWGGYAPTPTYRLTLADGRRAFFKGTSRDSNAFMKAALLSEERVYRDLGTTLGRWMPQLYATFHYDDWHVLILEDLGSTSVLPWTPEKIRAVTHALAAFHLSSLGIQPPAWLPQPDQALSRENWVQTAQESQEFQKIAALAGTASSQALVWFHEISPIIDHAMQQPALRDGTYAILHGDLRSDNLRFIQGQLYLFDWPAIILGRPEWDIVEFAQSVTVEGGPPPEQVMGWYGEQFPLNTNAVECALAWWLTFFARRAWQPDIPGLPRLRRFQRQQLGVLVSWAARHWSFPQPEWAKQLLE
ncbi:MAG: phosphotransferase, partial [Ktedonobacteraceae bacterium]|nr:phosphotransferase [Ktedonobacteraceae bacterium]